MLVHSPAGSVSASFDTRASGLLRWLVLGAAGCIALLLAISHAGAVGAAAPTTYDSTICINYFTCYNSGTGTPVSNTTSGYPTYVAPTTTATGYPANTVVSTYFDPRYCNGVVSVVTDASGTLIDVCAATGQRIYPVFPDYGYGFGGYVNGNFVNNGFFNGVYPNFVNNNGFVNNGCPVGNFACLGAFPFFGGFPYSTGVFSGNYAVVAPGGKPIVVGSPYRVKEVAAPASATTAVAQPAPAPVAAPAANTATALNTANAAPAIAPTATTGGGTGIHVLSASPATTPAVSKDADDHRG